MATDEQALICDLAETYQIYDWRSKPVRLIATLTAGLKPDSRIMMRLSGLSVSPEMYLLASILDGVNWLVWSKTEDGEKNRNRPKSMVAMLTKDDEKPDVQTFRTGEEFERAREKILGAINNGN